MGFGKPDAMDGVAPVNANSRFRLVVGRSDDQVFNVKVTNSRLRYVNDCVGWETMLHRILSRHWPDGQVVP